MAGSWTVVGSPKHAEKMLIQLRSPTAPSWPAVHYSTLYYTSSNNGNGNDGHFPSNIILVNITFITANIYQEVLQELFEINLTFEVNGVYQDLIGFH